MSGFVPGSIEIGTATMPAAAVPPGQSEFDFGYYRWRVVLAAFGLRAFSTLYGLT